MSTKEFVYRQKIGNHTKWRNKSVEGENDPDLQNPKHIEQAHFMGSFNTKQDKLLPKTHLRCASFSLQPSIHPKK